MNHHKSSLDQKSSPIEASAAWARRLARESGTSRDQALDQVSGFWLVRRARVSLHNAVQKRASL
jgi:hypothetical protein